MQIQVLTELINQQLADEIVTTAMLQVFMDSVIDDINAKLNAKFPTITVEIDKNGKRKWNWTPKAEQQVLKVVNEIYGSTDAHFLYKDPNSNTIVFTHGSFPETADTREFVKLVSSDGKRIDF